MSSKNRRSVLIILFAWLSYLISYLGRADYGACMLTIINETGTARATAGLVSSVFSLTNAFGQLVSGLVMKKIPPVKVIGAELFAVAVINLLFPMSQSFFVMTLLWGINGCMQSTLLCGAMQIFVENLKEPYLSRGAVSLNTIGAIGGVCNFVLSWVVIRYLRWQFVFISVASLLFILGMVWFLVMPKLVGKKLENVVSDAPVHKEPSKEKSVFSQIRMYGTIFVILAAFFIGLLRESVSLWIPSYMNEVYGFSNTLSTILTVFVPCLQICGALLGGLLGGRVQNLHFPSGIAFISSAVALFSIQFLGNASIVITLVLFVLNAVCMTAALTFLQNLFPIRYFGKGQVPMLVGIINFCVHIGDFAASSGIGWLSQNGGWNTTFIVLSILALIAAVICLVGGTICKRETAKEP